MGLIIKGLHIDEIIIGMDTEEEQTEPVQEEKEEPVKKAPKKSTKPIDKGKVGALYKAGWSVPKIADEMRCGQSTIYKLIKEMEL